MQKLLPEVFYKKTVVKKIAIFTEKHLCCSLFLIQNIAKSLRAAILKNICERLLLFINVFMKPYDENEKK